MSAFTEFLENYWGGLIGIPPLGAAITYLIKRNTAYKAIIDDFKVKLPRPSKRAKTMTEAQKAAHPFLGTGIFNRINVMNTSPHEITMDPNELDVFFNKLNDFSYFCVIHRKRYKQITQNLKRFENAKAKNKDFDIIVLQELLERTKFGFWEIVWETITLRLGLIRHRITVWKYNWQGWRNRRKKRLQKRR